VRVEGERLDVGSDAESYECGDVGAVEVGAADRAVLGPIVVGTEYLERSGEVETGDEPRVQAAAIGVDAGDAVVERPVQVRTVEGEPTSVGEARKAYVRVRGAGAVEVRATDAIRGQPVDVAGG
jgi:hypothetical protein